MNKANIAMLRNNAIRDIKRSAVPPSLIEEIDFDVISTIINRALNQAAGITPPTKKEPK